MSSKGKIIISILGVAISTALLIASAVLAENAVISPISAVVLIYASVSLIFATIFFAAKVDYECRKCGHVFKPIFKAYIWGTHTLTTRQLKCSRCGEQSWCKRKTAG